MKTIKRFTFDATTADTEPTANVQLAGFKRFRILDVHAAFTNNDATTGQTGIRIGNPADTGWHVAPGATVPAGNTVNVCHYIGATAHSFQLAGENTGAPLADIAWDCDVMVRLTTICTAYQFGVVSILVEYDTD